jgi:hypothetical protein
MSEHIAKKIEQRTGNEDLITVLSEKLSGSQLNSVLLEVFARRTKSLTPGGLLKQYTGNRFVHPAETDMLHLLRKSQDTLTVFQKHGFTPLHLSPLSQLGSCSVVGTVDQDKIVSGVRGCEILSDATNSLALHISHLKKNKLYQAASPEEQLKFSTVQRHVRAQPTMFKGFSPHFTIGCMVSSGKDTGDYIFEKTALLQHFVAYEEVLRNIFKRPVHYFKIQKRRGYIDSDSLIGKLIEHLKTSNPEFNIQVETDPKENNYYQGIQFKVMITVKEREFEIADGGFVDWTQKLLSNKKERFMISGFGLELLNKMEEGLM